MAESEAPKGPSKAEQKAAAKAEREAARDSQNGVTRPKAKTMTGRIWEISDELSRSHPGTPAGRAEVIAKALGENLNEATAATQYGKWRKYHGLKAEAKPPKEAVAPKSGDVTTQASPA